LIAQGIPGKTGPRGWGNDKTHCDKKLAKIEAHLILELPPPGLPNQCNVKEQ